MAVSLVRFFDAFLTRVDLINRKHRTKKLMTMLKATHQGGDVDIM